MKLSTLRAVPFALLFVLLAATAAPGAGGAGGSAAPTITARLLSEHESAQPSGKSALAVEVRIEKDWHMYHPVHLDAGGPTRVTFTAPEGVTFGPLRYPTPDSGELDGFKYFGYADRFVVLTEARFDAALKPGATLSIGARVEGYACSKGCVPVDLSTVLTLPVKPGDPKPANTALFKEARAAITPPIADAKYLEGSAIEISRPTIKPGETIEIIATIKVRPGHHIQDRDPGNKDLIGAGVYIEPIDGLEYLPQVWPAAKKKVVPDIGTVNEQSGEFKVRAPLKIADAKMRKGTMQLRVLVHYQCCTDAGQCYPPEVAEGFATVEIESNGAAAAAAEPLGTYLPGRIVGDGKAAAATAGGRDAIASSTGGEPLTPFKLALVFLGAFAGGAFLNIMPCVLPVLSLKIFSFMQQADEEPHRVRVMGALYAVGILSSFAVVAALMISLGLAWGGLMQEPNYIIGLSAVVFAFALSLLGVFELKLPGIVENAAGAVTTREGYGGALLNGALATALATPCVGPFLGASVGVLLSLPWWVAGLGIMTVGLGMAAPYVLLTSFPQWLKHVPKPGKWMVTFKQFMGFTLVATTIWLLFILQYLVPTELLVGTLAFLAVVAMACWLVGLLRYGDTVGRTVITYSFASALLLGGGLFSFGWLGVSSGVVNAAQGEVDEAALEDAIAKIKASSAENGVVWNAWLPGLSDRLAERGYTVYVDFTAIWCLTCQRNKKAVLHTSDIESIYKEQGVVAIMADFTKRSPLIQKELRRYNRAAVPLNIVIPAGRPAETIILPEWLSIAEVKAALEQAGPSHPGGSADLAATSP